MSTDQNDPKEEPIPLELDPEPQPVPVPPPDSRSGPPPIPVPPPTPAGPQPVPVPPPARKLVEEPESISLVDDANVDAPVEHMKRITGAAARGLTHKQEFKRQLNFTGAGATRCRIFNAKISEGPLLHMEGMINEWLDGEEIEVKHVGHVIGIMEAKRSEPNLLVMVWY